MNTQVDTDMTGNHAGTPTEAEIRAVFGGLMIVLALAAIDQSIVSTALPRIVAELGGVTHLSWVVTAYVLASTSTMPLYGKFSDHYGRRPVLYGAILVFLLGSILSGAARTLPQLILFRAVQGVGAGGLLPLSQIIIGDLVPPTERGRRQGAIVAVYAICSIVSPVLGGLITDLLSWHWIFYVNLPIGAVALIVLSKTLRRPFQVHERAIDYLGALLLTATTTAFLLVLSLGGSEWRWTSPQIAFLSAAAVLLGIGFALHVRRVPEPVLPPILFHNRVFVIACVVMALTFMGMLGASVFFPFFFQAVMGASPSRSGILTGPLMIGVVISSVVNGRVLLRSGRYKPAQTAGLAAAVASFGVLAWNIGAEPRFIIIEPAIFVLGLGLGLVLPNMTIAVQNALPAAHRGVGTATLTFFRSLGGLIGVTGGGAILAMQLHRVMKPAALSAAGGQSIAAGGTSSIETLSAESHPLLVAIYQHAIATVFTVGGCMVVLALIAILFLPELPLRQSSDRA